MATFGVDPIPATAVCARDPGSRRRDHSSLVGGDLARFSPTMRFVDASTAVQLVGTGRRTTRVHHLPAPARRRGQRRRRVARAVVRRVAWAEGAHAQRGAQDTIMLSQLQQLLQNERGARVKQVPRGKGPPEPQVAGYAAGGGHVTSLVALLIEAAPC